MRPATDGAALARAALPQPGTPQRPLYHWHIPKTAGNSLARVLEYAFPVTALELTTLVRDWDPAADRSRIACISGHLGTLVPESWPGPLATVTVLRQPVERAWSHWEALTRRDGPSEFCAAAASPGHRWLIENYQAHWLTGSPSVEIPDPALPRPDDPVGGTRRWRRHLWRRAAGSLARIDVVGVTERLDDTVEVLSRFLGRPLSPAPSLNVNPAASDMPTRAERVARQLNTVDRRLWELAQRRLDSALATLPALPARPLQRGPWSFTMEDALVGSGWHGRTHTDTVGWHRWSGPERRSVVWPDVRFAGPVEIEVEVVAAAADDIVRGLTIEVQGRSLSHELRPGKPGIVVTASTDADGGRACDIVLTVPHLARVSSGDTRSDPCALAVRALHVRPAA